MEKLELIETLKKVVTFDELIDLNPELEKYDVCICNYIKYMHTEDINYYIEAIAGQYDWVTVYHVLKNIEWLGDDYYKFNVYEYLEEITSNDVKDVVDDIIKDLECK